VLTAAKESAHVFPLAALRLFAENSHQGHHAPSSTFRPGALLAISNTATGMPVCLYDSGARSCCSSKERDAETGLDFFGARYFSSAQGRFTSPDPGGVGAHPGSPQTWNMYSYTGNNPLSATDPNGLDCVYTSNQTDSSITATITRGNCGANDGGTFVNGTIDENSLKYTGSSLDIGYTDANGAVGTYSKGLPDAPDPGLMTLQRAGQIAGPVADPRNIAAFYGASILGGTAYAAYGAYTGSAAIASFSLRAAALAARLAAAVAALKQLSPEQYKLVQDWVGKLKPGNPITSPPPGLTPDAMQRYVDVAKAYLANGGPGVAVQQFRIAAIESVLGK
jgi:RHS repeat-associated protein